MNKVTHKIALKLIEQLMKRDPSPRSIDGKLLRGLSDMVVSYEKYEMKNYYSREQKKSKIK